MSNAERVAENRKDAIPPHVLSEGGYSMKQKVSVASSECGPTYADPEGICKCGEKEKTDTSW